MEVIEPVLIYYVMILFLAYCSLVGSWRPKQNFSLFLYLNLKVQV